MLVIIENILVNKMRFLFLVIMTLVSVAHADSNPTFVKRYNNWEVYVHTDIEDGEKVCFIASSPIDKAGTYKKRTESYLWVRHVTKKIDEVSVTAGYKYKIGFYPEISIHGKQDLDEKKQESLIQKSRNGNCEVNKQPKYALTLVDQEQAWARETETDTKIIASLKNSYRAVVTATSTLDSCSTDIYSLMGFTKAYEHMKSLCAQTE